MYSIMNNVFVNLLPLSFSLLLLLIFKKFILVRDEKEGYNKLLESPENYSFGKENIKDIPLDNNLLKTIDNFMIKHNLYQNGVIVSLSGGVDSMVVLAILLRLQIEREFPIYTSTINYNLRKESYDESEFLIKYCDYHKVITRTEHLNGTFSNNNKRGLVSNNNSIGKRSEFEEASKDIRYNSYKEIIDKYNCQGVMVGHHGDDIIENIFTNSMKGHNLLDIEVMKENNNIRGVNIYRPLLDHRKCEILKLAHKFDIPYFLDTTPKWSRRGQMRNEIFPLFTKVFGQSWKNKFKEIGTQSNNWNDTVQKLIIDPWLNDIYFGKYGFILPLKYTNDTNLWTYTLPKLFFKINYGTIKKRTIIKLLDIINKHTIRKPIIILDSGFRGFILSDKLIIYHYDDILENKNLSLVEIRLLKNLGKSKTRLLEQYRELIS